MWIYIHGFIYLYIYVCIYIYVFIYIYVYLDIRQWLAQVIFYSVLDSKHRLISFKTWTCLLNICFLFCDRVCRTLPNVLTMCFSIHFVWGISANVYIYIYIYIYIIYIYIYMYIYIYKVIPRPTLGHWQEGSFIHPMFITASTITSLTERLPGALKLGWDCWTHQWNLNWLIQGQLCVTDKDVDSLIQC